MSAAQRQQTEQNQTDSDTEAVEPEQSERMDSAPVESTPAEPAAAPLTSLDSLFGGALEGASTCAGDGTCD